MKFIKSYKIFEAKTAVNKDENAEKVLDFLNKSKGVNTQAQITKGTKIKNDTVYTTLTALKDDKKVGIVKVKDYSVLHIPNHPTWYPHYYSTDALTKDEAEKLAKELEEISFEENKDANEKRKIGAKKAVQAREEKREVASKTRATKKEDPKKEDAKPAARKPRAKKR